MELKLLFSRGSKEAQLCIELAYHPISVVTIGKNIVVGCTDATLQSYSTKVSENRSYINYKKCARYNHLNVVFIQY